MLLELVNHYKFPPDFRKLANHVQWFKPYVISTVSGLPTIDFQSDEAIRALTGALLERDFKLHISLPTDRLCPMVPGRYEYVYWILTLMASTSKEYLSAVPSFTGIDIGCGASAIYSLLAIRTLPNLKMITTEIDDRSIEFAQKNITLNGLENQISLLKVTNLGSLLPPQIYDATECIDFTMCNPPFYASENEIATALEKNPNRPHAVCTGSSSEMITPGGEVAFVLKLVEESILLRNKIRWFSSLLGRYSSIASVLVQFKEYKINNYALYESIHGRTKRWMIAWSLQEQRLPDSLARSDSASLAKFLPLPNSRSLKCTSATSLSNARELVLVALKDANLVGNLLQSGSIQVKVHTQSWSRALRRKRIQNEAFNEDPLKNLIDINRLIDSHKPLLFSAVVDVNLTESGIVEIRATLESGIEQTPFFSFWVYLISKA